jgi:dynein light chain Tctex-type 1
MTEKITLADDASVIAHDVVSRIFMPEAVYNHQKVPQLVSQICDTVVQKLVQTAKLPRKYIAHCAVVQKNGAGFHALSACSWNQASDSCYVYTAENKAMHCVLTIYGITM